MGMLYCSYCGNNSIVIYSTYLNNLLNQHKHKPL